MGVGVGVGGGMGGQVYGPTRVALRVVWVVGVVGLCPLRPIPQ